MLGKLIFLALACLAVARPKSEDHSVPTNCPPDAHWVLPHEWDCTKFYYCEYGLRWEQPTNCAPGTEFSYELQVCVHPEVANCKLPNVPPSESAENDVSNSGNSQEDGNSAENIGKESHENANSDQDENGNLSVGDKVDSVEEHNGNKSEESKGDDNVENKEESSEEKAPSAEDQNNSDNDGNSSVDDSENANSQGDEEDKQESIEEKAPSAEDQNNSDNDENDDENANSKGDEEVKQESSEEKAPSAEDQNNSENDGNDSQDADSKGDEEDKQESSEEKGPSAEEQNAHSDENNKPSVEQESSAENNGYDNYSENAKIESSEEVKLLANGCPSDSAFGVVPHETDCDKFYICAWGEKVLESCAPGTLFNPAISVCDHPENVKCGTSGNGDNDNSSEGNNGHISHEDNSSEGKHNNNSSEGKNDNENSSEDNNGNNSSEGHNNSNSSEGKHDNNSSEDNNGSSEEKPEHNGCPTDNSFRLLPHEHDCNKFYSCVWGEKVEQHCAAGLFFNPAISVCDYPQNVKCGASSNEHDNESSNESGKDNSHEENHGSNSSEGKHDNNSSEDNNGSSEEKPEHNGCPTDNSFRLLPHEHDCNKFYSCVWGEKVEQHCAAGLFFNPAISVCDYPQNVKCGASSNEHDNESSNESGKDNSHEDNHGSNSSEGKHDNNSIEDNDGSSEEKPEHNGCPTDNSFRLLPHEHDCNKFYSCVWGEKVEQHCATGLFFNPAISVCDYPQNVKCGASSNEHDNESSNESDKDNSREDNHGSNSSEGKHDNNSSEDNNGSSEEKPEHNGCPTDNSFRLLPHEHDCNKFYSCVWGEKVEQHCATGLFFNPAISVCDYPQNVKCGASSNEHDKESSNESDKDNSREDNHGSNSSEGKHDNNSSEDNNGSSEEKPEHNGCPTDNSFRLLPHEHDCNKFYSCVWGEKVEQHCAAGLFFNPAISVCDYPQNVKCGASSNEHDNESSNESDKDNSHEDNHGSNSSEGKHDNNSSEDNGSSEEKPEHNGCPTDNSFRLLPHEHDCNKFYSCVWGEKVEQHCAAGLFFNPAISVCDYPQNVKCGASSNEHDNESSNESGKDNSREYNHGSNSSEGKHDNNSSEDNNGSSEEKPEHNGCPTDNSFRLLPHEHDCNKFYSCVWGEKVEQHCATGLFFNPAISVCDYPQNVKCGASSNEHDNESSNESGKDNSHEDNHGSNSSEGKHDNNSSEDNNGSSEEKPEHNGCPTDNSFRLLPHEHDCNKFYSCVWGEKVEQHCAAGLFFNPAISVCDYPQNVKCGASSNEHDNENSNESGKDNSHEDNHGSNSSEGKHDNNSSEDNNGSSEEKPEHNGCPTDNSFRLLPHEDDCNKFYSCVWGEKVEQHCAAGLFFNPAISVCDYPQNVKCGASSNEHDNESSNESGKDNSHEDNHGSNSSEGKHDNNSSEDNNGSSEEKPENNGCPTDNSFRLLPHEHDCNKFYSCVWGEKVEQHCATGLFFNPAISVCDYPQNVKCGASSNEHDNESSNESGKDNSHEDNHSSNSSEGKYDNNSSEDNNGSSEEKPEHNGCPTDNSFRLLPHEHDCNKFYSCVWGEKVEQHCATGLFFNPAISVCDYPQNVKCGASSNEHDNESSNESGKDNSREDNHGSNSSEGKHDNNSSEDNNGSSEEKPEHNGCPTDNSFRLLPHEHDCNKFYSCVWGEKVEQHCAAGLFFNPAISVCDYPQNVKCGASSGENSASNENGNSKDSSSEEHKENEQESADEICRNNCNISTWSKLNSCTQYWSCKGEVAVLNTCSSGLNYNKETGACDFQENASCEY